MREFAVFLRADDGDGSQKPGATIAHELTAGDVRTESTRAQRCAAQRAQFLLQSLVFFRQLIETFVGARLLRGSAFDALPNFRKRLLHFTGNHDCPLRHECIPADRGTERADVREPIRESVKAESD